jgi:hypothetical protein
MIEKLVTVVFVLALTALLASSFSIPVSQPERPKQSCYRSLAGSGWLCAWEPSPGEKCWQTSSGSGCSRLPAARSETTDVMTPERATPRTTRAKRVERLADASRVGAVQ